MPAFDARTGLVSNSYATLVEAELSRPGRATLWLLRTFRLAKVLARRERRHTRLQPHPHQPEPLLDGAVPRGRAVHPHARLPSALRGGHLCSPIRPRGALLSTLGGAMICVCVNFSAHTHGTLIQ